MISERPIVLAIGGHDPSAGAGVTADIKTMEAIGVQGMSVCSSITFQTEDKFEGLKWMSRKELKSQLRPLLERYHISHIKIGIIENLKTLKWLVKSLKEWNPHVCIIWDPVVKTSSGYTLHDKLSIRQLRSTLQYIDVITPNWNEITELSGNNDATAAAKKLSSFVSVYLKGGHHEENIGVDYLFHQGEQIVLLPEYLSNNEKHGSGCIFASALASYLALNHPLDIACVAAKRYILEYLDSTDSLLGIHYQTL